MSTIVVSATTAVAGVPREASCGVARPVTEHCETGGDDRWWPDPPLVAERRPAPKVATSPPRRGRAGGRRRALGARCWKPGAGHRVLAPGAGRRVHGPGVGCWATGAGRPVRPGLPAEVAEQADAIPSIGATRRRARSESSCGRRLVCVPPASPVVHGDGCGIRTALGRCRTRSARRRPIGEYDRYGGSVHRSRVRCIGICRGPGSGWRGIR